MDRLRARVTTAIITIFLLLLVTDVLDDLFLSNRWAGCPKELYAVVGAIVAGLFAAQALRVGGNGNSKAKDGN